MESIFPSWAVIIVDGLPVQRVPFFCAMVKWRSKPGMPVHTGRRQDTIEVTANVPKKANKIDVYQVLPLAAGHTLSRCLLRQASPSGRKNSTTSTIARSSISAPLKNWTNDPNGMMYYKGEYHLFFQHNPFGKNWGNMTWGHAVSPDMFHWTQLDHAILPDKLGTVFSGSGVVDWENTAGFQTGDEKVLVCIYTSARAAFHSVDRLQQRSRRTWTKYAGNPVLKHIAGSNRDPKVFWHAPSKKWIMALFLDGNTYALFASPDLKQWSKLCDVPVPGGSECPDFFELPVDGDAAKSKWVFWSANNSYLLGTFDGKVFRKEAGPLRTHYGKHRYAAQTFSDIPKEDGRRLQIAWMSGGQYPEMPFNQQMSLPVSLVLRTFPEGVRLCTLPVKEVEALRTGEKFAWRHAESGRQPAGENFRRTVRHQSGHRTGHGDRSRPDCPWHTDML